MPSPSSSRDRAVLKSLLAIGLLLVATTAEAAKGDATYTVVGKKTVGNIKVGVAIGHAAPGFVEVHVGLADSRDKVAENIAKAVGHGAARSGRA